ncbi:MAG: pitrilysin family protein [Anaerolineae bacterium]|jgi:zinc protease
MMSLPGPHDIARYGLPNGIVLLVRENRASPSVVVTGFLRVGAYDEEVERAGLADFTASALARGTGNRTFEQIYSEVESVGASFGIGGGIHTTGFGAKSLAEDLPLVLGILADVLRHPVFPEDEVEKLRGEILADLAERAHDTRRMAHLAFRELAYPQGHPYAVSSIGYPETIAAIDRDDLMAFYTGGYGAAGAVIVVVGAAEPEDVLAQVEDAFGDWVGHTYQRQPLPDVPRIDQVRSRTVAIPDKTQSDIALGYPGPSRMHPDYLDARVCNTILGVFGLMGRLGENVRDEQGLAYYSYSHISGGAGPGPWRVIAGVSPANVERATESIRAEIRRVCEEPVGQEELRDTQAYLAGSMPLHLETNGGVASSMLAMERYGLGLDYLQRYKNLIDEVTPERVQATAQRWLDPDAYALAVAGPPTAAG